MVFTLLVLLSQDAFACIPGRSDPWFATQLSFDQNTLPSGIEIVQTDSTYESLINKSSEPFYLVRENFTDWKTFPNSELPQNYEPRYKLVNNQSFYYLEDTYSKPPKPGYRLNSGGINNSATTRVRIDENVYILEGDSRQIYQDNRPADVEIPEPQSFKILGFYKGNPLEIHGRLSYSLNEKYDPQRFAKGVKACNDWNKWGILFSLLPIAIAVSFIGLIIFAVYKIFRAIKSRRKV